MGPITTAIQNAWGSVYESDLKAFGYFDSGLFIEKPIVCIHPTGIACWVESLNSTTKDYIGQAYLSRPVSTGSSTYTFNVIAIGRWK